MSAPAAEVAVDARAPRLFLPRSILVTRNPRSGTVWTMHFRWGSPTNKIDRSLSRTEGRAQTIAVNITAITI